MHHKYNDVNDMNKSKVAILAKNRVFLGHLKM